MAEKLNIELRESFGKGAARQIRRDGKVPAVVYGHGMEPLHVVLPGHETALAARNANALLELVLPDGKTQLALIKEIQRHPLHRSLAHLDLIAVRRGEKVDVDIPVTLVGEPVSPAIAVVDLLALTLSVDALNVPEQVEISVEGLEDGAQIFAGDVTLPEGTSLVSDAELIVIAVQTPRGEVEDDAEETAAEETSEEA